VGAWGVGPFDNDAALDWAVELESEGMDAIDRALDGAHRSAELESDAASEAIAAAATVVAAVRGDVGALPDEVRAWLAQNRMDVDPPLVDRATEALASVRTSELADLWAESDDLASWLETLNDLERALRSY
jgi:hypothetical protein